MISEKMKILEDYKKESCDECPEESIFLYINGKPISFKQARENIVSGNEKFIKMVF